MRIIVFSTLLVYLTLAQARGHKVIFKNAEIEIDGILNEAVWKKLEAYTNFSTFFPRDDEETKNQTIVKLFHDGHYLYISSIYMDQSKKIIINSLKRDDHFNSFVISDGFGLTIDPYNKKQSGYYFAVNAAGAIVDGLVENSGDGFHINTSWNTNWEVKTSMDGANKIFEIKIPFKSLSYSNENSNWGFQFFVKDSKINRWMSYSRLKQNNRQYDLRYTKSFKIGNLPQSAASRFTFTPSLASNYQNDFDVKTEENHVTPSLDIQYNLTSSLRLDATINPDFSQIDVDQQVTNLSRFSIRFPERRNFFIENSDLFSKLGANGVNPFYSRRIGASSDILFGLKLSGNVASNTRIGLLNAQTEEKNDIAAQNNTVAVAQRKLSDQFTLTGFFINRQETNNLDFLSNYNRVTGLNINFKSKNKKWTSLANFAKSYSTGINTKNNFLNLRFWYSSRKVYSNFGLKRVEKNYITDLGFVPRLSNYDPVKNEVIRKSYIQSTAYLAMFRYPKSGFLERHRYFSLRNFSYFNTNKSVAESSSAFNNGFFFKNTSFAYFTLSHDYINLEYNFDPLGEGNAIQADKYHNTALKIGYGSARNKKLFVTGSILYGSYYGGNRSRFSLEAKYQLLSLASLNIEYELNKIDLNNLGEKDFHLLKFTSELFFSKQVNWTTYLQYNRQADNFNVNSRLQWEYEPLSYIYFVITNNRNKYLSQKNWGVALKVNYRLEI